ncbi:TonB-dependent receptor domain-containing protein [Xanthocytophaga flava]|uniref:TonB-dependent receptor domain-containing protein n=1 Tax=Xanthocytophaga flava TaxID=3048013 RepID=UPI0028D7DC66|nr:TonB-dependent receptor [Xanthocytophaga flavus]MDJ1470312.1 TonB-dependent receptor [Xanthocytophaga flavus]
MKYHTYIFIFLFFASFFGFQRLSAQAGKVVVSGVIKDAATKAMLPFVNVTLYSQKDTVFLTGTITNEEGLFTLPAVNSGSYVLKATYLGFEPITQSLQIGQLSEFLHIGTIELTAQTTQLNEVVIQGSSDAVSRSMEKKTFSLADNLSQSGGSVLQAMKNLPGITVGEGGSVQLRGNDKVMVLIDGKQTALTGFGSQSGLDNIPASAIEKIEIINNPSARYDANGNAGIINLVFKKEKKEGLNGKVGFSAGLGALWVKQENYPTIRPQYQTTPKINPSFSLNYRKGKTNLFVQVDNLYTQTLNKNEFTDRFYDSGQLIRQQLKRNRNTNVTTLKSGIDWMVNEQNTFSFSGLFSSEKIIDRGDEPFFTYDLSERKRLWQFLEDELKTTVTASASWLHTFRQAGRKLNMGFNYTFHREDEKYFFTNVMPTYTGKDAFKLLSDENVSDLTIDYTHPLKYGHLEAGFKLRRRYIPTNMQFFPGYNSPLDSSAGGWANYGETIPALYGNYVFESKYLEVEAGLRAEYVNLRYQVNPTHPTYKSNGYTYGQLFPSVRVSYKLNELNRISLFYNRRVDRPNEVDIRIFPKYDDAEIIKVGNPALRPQFTNSVEIGYKNSHPGGFVYVSLYHKQVNATITRISSTTNATGADNTLIYAIFQNAGHSYTTGMEIIYSWQLQKWATLSLNLNGYQNTIDAFSVVNLYPVENTFTAERQSLFSGNIKLNGLFRLPRKIEAQFSAIYLAPDIVPQGKVYSRFSIDMGAKKTVQNGKGELFVNATDIAATLKIKRRIQGDGFHYISTDYYETQVVRVGYNYKF